MIRREWTKQKDGSEILFEWDDSQFKPCRTTESTLPDGTVVRVTACYNPLLKIVARR